jgi:energy-coupling factor transporter ATP-binding protein EcfA2
VRVLDQVSLVLRQGTVTALVGRSGAGKSTLAALLSRFYEPEKGGQRCRPAAWLPGCLAAWLVCMHAHACLRLLDRRLARRLQGVSTRGRRCWRSHGVRRNAI